MIVMKFGGTSVESAEAIRRVASIVEARLERLPIVVVSAMGRTTNKLLAMAAEAVADRLDQAMRLLDELEKSHRCEAEQLVGPEQREGLDHLLRTHFQELCDVVKALAVVGELTPRLTDAIASYGERLSSAIVTLAFEHLGIRAVHVDARHLIVTDARYTQAGPQYEATYARLAAVMPGWVEDGCVVVMGGFIGATEDGVTTTLGRGGSDFSAAIVGAGVDAEEVQIWTDVDGMLTVDPRVLPGGHLIRQMSFGEAAELAYFGAKVLHPATVLPAVEKNIPLMILNSRRPEVEGTRITAASTPCKNAVKSISCKRGITLVNIQSTRMLMAFGFLQRIFDVFARHETPVDMVATSEVSVSLTIDNVGHLEAIVRELKEYAEVQVTSGQAIVCLVGDELRHTPGIVGRVFRTIPEIEVKMISQGASLLNLGFVVDEQDLVGAVSALHEEFFRELDERVFA